MNEDGGTRDFVEGETSELVTVEIAKVVLEGVCLEMLDMTNNVWGSAVTRRTRRDIWTSFSVSLTATDVDVFKSGGYV